MTSKSADFEYDEILIFAVGNTKYDAVMELKELRKNGGKYINKP